MRRPNVSNKSSVIGLNPIDENKHELNDNKNQSIKSNSMVSLKFFLYFIVSIIFMLTYFIVTRLGFGKYFRNQSITSQVPLLPSSVLEIVAELPIPPGNIAVSNNGDVYFNFHPEYDPKEVKIAKLINSTYWIPYPSLEFQKSIITCLSLRIDQQNRLWLLDFAQHGFKGLPRLLAIDLETQLVTIDYTFPSSIAGIGSMLNDFQVDPTGEFVYIVDTSIVGTTPAIIVFSVIQSRSFRILNSVSELYGDPIFLNVSNIPVKFGPFGLKINIDSVVLDKTGSHLYFGAVTSNNLYGISTASIKTLISSPSLKFKLEDHIKLITDEKPISDGLSIDLNNNIWITAFEHSSIAIAKHLPNNQYEIVKIVQDENLLRWPDGLSFGPDGLYITNSALHFKFNSQNLKSKKPFHILKINANHLKSICGSKLPPSGH